MRWLIVCGSMLAGLWTVSAQAADLGGDYRQPSYKDTYAPVYEPVFNWTGFYFGVQLGYGWAKTKAHSRITGVRENYDYNDSGLLGGGHTGYNIQSGNVVYGVEADLDFADIDYNSRGRLGDRHNTDLTYTGSIRGRLGYTWGQTLVYATGGWAYGDVHTRTWGPGVGRLISYSGFRNGWTVGGGVEQAFSRNVTARLEYRYVDLGSDDTARGAWFRDHSDFTMHTLRAGMSFRF